MTVKIFFGRVLKTSKLLSASRRASQRKALDPLLQESRVTTSTLFNKNQGYVLITGGRRWTGNYSRYWKLAYYRCPSNQAEHWRHKCENRFRIRQEVLEDVVWEKISNLFLEPETLMQGLAEQREVSHELVERKNRRIEAVDRAIQDVDRKLSVLLDQVLTGEFAQSVIDEKRKALMNQRAELEAEMYRLSFELEKTVITSGAEEELIAFASRVSGSIENADLETKRRILELVQTRVNVLGPKIIEICCLIQNVQIVDLSSSRVK